MTQYSTTEAAKFVGRNVSTIKRWSDSGKVSCTRDENGSRIFDKSELCRAFKIPLDEKSERASLSADKYLGAPKSGQYERLHVAEMKAVEVENSALRREVDSLKYQVEKWEEQSVKWEDMAKQSTRLLTDERGRYQQKEGEAAEKTAELSAAIEASKTPRSKIPLVLGLVVIAGAAALYLHPDTLRELLAGQGAPVVNAAALEIEPVTMDNPSNPPR